MSWRRFFRRAHRDRESAVELRSYLDIETDDNIARGMTPEEARRAAHVKLGNTVGIREDLYRLNTIGIVESIGRDLRLALRGVRRRPGFTLAVVLAELVTVGLLGGVTWLATGWPLLTACGTVALVYYPIATVLTGRVLSPAHLRSILKVHPAGAAHPAGTLEEAAAEPTPLYLVPRHAASASLVVGVTADEFPQPRTAAR